jgi:MFS family permease
MYNILHKYKRIGFLIVKLIIVFGAFYFIYQKLISNQLLTIEQLKNQFLILFSHSIWLVILVLICTDVNWLLEIIKWKKLASVEKKVSFFEAFEQSLASLTVSMITPNRIGEYGAKALFFEIEKRKNIMGLNLIGNLSQLAVTIFFGSIGITFFLLNFTVKIPKVTIQNSLILAVILVVLIYFRKQFKVNKIKIFLTKISKKTYFSILSLSVLRYLIFTHQFYFLLVLFGVELDYFTSLFLIFTIYLLASILPSLTIFDWAIKGSVAIFLFSFVNVNELTIVTITMLMYLLNFAIPAILGSIFVLNFKPINAK